MAVPGTAGARPHSGQEAHKVAKSGQGWLRVARSAQAWLRGIFKPISPDSGEGDWIYSGLQIQKKGIVFPCLMGLSARRKASGPERMVLWVSP